MFQSEGKEHLTERTGWPAVCRYCFHNVLIEQSSILAQFALCLNRHSGRKQDRLIIFMCIVAGDPVITCHMLDHSGGHSVRALIFTNSNRLRFLTPSKSIGFCLFMCCGLHAYMFKASTVVMYVNGRPI